MKFLKNMDTRYYDYNLTPEQKPIEKIVNSERRWQLETQV